METVLDQWYGPESIYFKVRADDGNLYILRQQTSTSDRLWDLVSFRQENTNKMQTRGFLRGDSLLIANKKRIC